MFLFAKVFNGHAQATDSPAVVENLFAAPLPIVTNAPAKTTFDVRKYRVEGNTVLPPADFGVLSNYTSTNLDFPRLREGLGKVQLRYRELGFPTISVTLPQQKLTNATVRIKIIEGKLNGIVVSGNHYFSSNNVMRALPSLTTNILLNTKWFQPELDQANANRDRQIYPVISPGLEPGTTELELKVKDRLPLHGRVEVNDKSSPGTPLLRVDTAVQYGNLWQREQQIGFDYNFSPQEFKSDDGSRLYDNPMVASYSGFYRLPLGFSHGLREDLDQQPVNFGYDEVSHKFNLPAPTGNPDVIFYASRSTSDTPVQYGATTTIFSNTLAEISSQSEDHAPTINNNIGMKLTIPLREFAGIKSSLLLGVDYKSYQSQLLYTNLTYFSLYALDSFGNRVLVTNETIRLPGNSAQSLYYLPLSVGWVAVRPDSSGSLLFTYNQNIFVESLSSARSDFQGVASSPAAGGNYTSLTAGLIRQQNLPWNWSAVLNANGQWASEPLINNEQFGLGGTMGVRGYQEGEVYGDTGWRTLFDLRAPPANIGYFPTSSGDVPAALRGSWFMDYGRIYLLDQTIPGTHHLNEWGTGFSFFLTVGEHFDARLTTAWALLGAAAGPGATANRVFVRTPTGDAQVYFTVGFQF